MSPEQKSDKYFEKVVAEKIGRKKIKLSFPDGSSRIVPLVTKKGWGMTDREYLALNVMLGSVPIAFSDETTALGNSPTYQMDQESEVKNMPHKAEASPEEALSWAGAVLQASGRWDSERIAKWVIGKYGKVNTNFHLGSLSKDLRDTQVKTLQRVIAEHFPGAKAAIKRSKMNRGKYPDF